VLTIGSCFTNNFVYNLRLHNNMRLASHNTTHDTYQK
jgi:hypothetical protein